MSIVGTLKYILNHPLNREHKGAAVLRYARWQLGSRISAREQIVPFAGGASLVVSRGMSGATGNVYCGLDEFPSMGFTLHLLRPGDLFLDVGANIGSYTMLAAEAGADCIAFEPNNAARAMLKRNIRLNDFGARVAAEPFCVGRAPGHVAMTTGKGPGNHVTDAGDAGASDVEVVSLDGFLTAPATFAKIDVEGYEMEVLGGAARTLADPHLLALTIEMEAGGAEAPKNRGVCGVMNQNGFTAHEYEPLSRVLTPIEGICLTENNTIFVRDTAAVRARLQAAPRYVVQGRAV